MPANREQRPKTYRPRAQLLPWVQKIAYDFAEYETYFGGSWRRGADLIGDLDVLLINPLGKLPHNLNERAGDLILVESRGDRLAHFQVQIDSEMPLQVDFYACTPEERGAFLWFITGPQSLNIAMRWDAKQQGMTLSQYGLFRLSDHAYMAGPTEKSVAEALGQQWVDVLEPHRRQRWATPHKQKAETVQVEGSKGAIYTLTVQGEQISCDCPGFRYRRRCRHVEEFRALNTALSL